MAEGIRKRHAKGCGAREGGRRNCNAGWEAAIYLAREPPGNSHSSRPSMRKPPICGAFSAAERSRTSTDLEGPQGPQPGVQCSVTSRLRADVLENDELALGMLDWPELESEHRAGPESVAESLEGAGAGRVPAALDPRDG